MKMALTIAVFFMAGSAAAAANNRGVTDRQIAFAAVPATYDECVANGSIANCDSYPDAPQNRPRILSEVKTYHECITSNLAIDCKGLPGEPKHRRRASIMMSE